MPRMPSAAAVCARHTPKRPSALAAAGIEFVMLKGFTHESAGLGVRWLRPACQYDLDILTQPCDVARARAVFERLGYAPHGAQSLSEEHGRPLVRPSDWSWRGDYYDPEMPIPVELHGSAWSAEHDRIHPAGMEEFWSRRCLIEVNGLAYSRLRGSGPPGVRGSARVAAYPAPRREAGARAGTGAVSGSARRGYALLGSVARIAPA